jgi:hypothetical protein
MRRRPRRRPKRPLASLTMPLRPLGATAVLAGLDLGAWEWATGTDHPTVGLIAGLLMAPIALALAWSIVRVFVSLAQLAMRRLTADTRSGSRQAPRTEAPVPFDIERDDRRIAA